METIFHVKHLSQFEKSVASLLGSGINGNNGVNTALTPDNYKSLPY